MGEVDIISRIEAAKRTLLTRWKESEPSHILLSRDERNELLDLLGEDTRVTLQAEDDPVYKVLRYDGFLVETNDKRSGFIGTIRIGIPLTTVVLKG